MNDFPPKPGDTIQAKLDPQAVKKASAEFIFYYGDTMSEWASVERGLFNWFSLLTKMDDHMARRIFYGVRGFNARADMLASVIDALGPAPHKLPDFLREAVTRSRQYSVFRNRIAHGEPTPRVLLSRWEAKALQESSQQTVEIVISDAKTHDQEKIVTVSQLRIATNNFRILSQIMVRALPKFNTENKPPEEFLAQVSALPKEPDSEGDPIAKAPAQQPAGPPHRNKKEYRKSQKK